MKRPIIAQTPRHHDIRINLIHGAAVPDMAGADELRVDDTVKYFSPDGKVRVVFEGIGPFGTAVSETVLDGERRTLKTAGKFFCRCFITPTGSTTEIGWSPATPESGGDHDVKP
ncbi:MAG: hypothetical protein DMF56_23670 [Acidobacteria bacterium]|jgi:hypothetical protein|nr:MAG: hypothetical protein DMF56_23670 [Acidobacteriota bacterium]